MLKEKKPLYRKVNTKALHHHHHTGPDAKNQRNTKQGISRSMSKDKQRGLDFTPLYKFLLSKIGSNWDKVHSEAVSRIPIGEEDAIYHIVYKESDDYNKKLTLERGYTLCGESSRYSLLVIDEDNKLALAKPELKNEDIHPSCNCCTHTFNGKVLVNKFNSNR